MSEPSTETYYRFPSEITDILSFGYQHPENVNFRKALKEKATAKNHPLLMLRDLCQLRDESIEPSNQPDEFFQYLGLADIESNTGQVIEYQKMLGKDILSKAAVFYEGDIVFGRLRPYLNKVHLVNVSKAIGSSELYVVKTDTTQVNPDFLVRYLLSDLTLTQTKWILTGNSYPRLAKDDFLNLSIIVPDIKLGIQEKIVDEVSKLETESTQSSNKASALVGEAYELFPQKLSIRVPSKTDYEFFAVPMNQVADRLDFNFNLEEYRELGRELNQSSDSYRFGDILDGECGLTNGVEIRNFVEEGSPYLRVCDVAHNKLNLEDVAKVDAKLSDLTKNIKLECGNLIISRSGTLGIVLLVDDTFPIDELILSSHLIKVVLKNSIDGKRIDPRYVFYFLRSSIGQMQFNQISYGSSVPEVNQEFLSSMKIVIPDEATQSHILRLVDEKVTEATRLENIANQKWVESRQKFIDLLLN